MNFGRYSLVRAKGWALRTGSREGVGVALWFAGESEREGATATATSLVTSSWAGLIGGHEFNDP